MIPVAFKRTNLIPLILALTCAAVIYAGLYLALGLDFLSASAWDSYTLQALAWLKGQSHLDQNYTHLELVEVAGKVYVSFPPVPSVAILPWVIIFGAHTPSNLIVTWYGLSCLVAAYFLGLKFTDAKSSAILACFLVLGSNLLSITVNGGVWFQAQSLSFLFCLLAIYFCHTASGIRSAAVGLLFLGLAVGCRPFQIVFAPVCFLLVQKHAGRSFSAWLTALSGFIFALFCLAAYNYLRFQNPMEFGHNYLVEHLQNPFGQFHWRYIPENLWHTLRWPWEITNGTWSLHRFNGFAFFVANPIFILIGLALIRQRKRLDKIDTLLLAAMALEYLFICAHVTLGGWQFGLRYSLDLLPWGFFLLLRHYSHVTLWETALAIVAIAWNAFGTIWLYGKN